MTGEIPQSQALKEAEPDSLSEVMSRDPEGYSRQDRDVIVAELRKQRARIAAAEAAGGGARTPRVSGPKPVLGKLAAKPADEMGL